jgi:hypothetical protein
MTVSVSYQCAWNGLSPDPDDRVFSCGRPASGYVLSPRGRRIHVCLEHIAWAKRVGESGFFVNSLFEDDAVPPTVQHAGVRQARRNHPVVGFVY